MSDSLPRNIRTYWKIERTSFAITAFPLVSLREETKNTENIGGYFTFIGTVLG